jgi:hypothetical protein
LPNVVDKWITGLAVNLDTAIYACTRSSLLSIYNIIYVSIV